jgi:hypothetical protein
MAFEAARIYWEMIKKVLHARAEALMEGAELHDISLDEAKDAILNELEQMKEWFAAPPTALNNFHICARSIWGRLWVAK